MNISYLKPNGEDEDDEEEDYYDEEDFEEETETVDNSEEAADAALKKKSNNNNNNNNNKSPTGKAITGGYSPSFSSPIMNKISSSNSGNHVKGSSNGNSKDFVAGSDLDSYMAARHFAEGDVEKAENLDGLNPPGDVNRKTNSRGNNRCSNSPVKSNSSVTKNSGSSFSTEKLLMSGGGGGGGGGAGYVNNSVDLKELLSKAPVQQVSARPSIDDNDMIRNIQQKILNSEKKRQQQEEEDEDDNGAAAAAAATGEAKGQPYRLSPSKKSEDAARCGGNISPPQHISPHKTGAVTAAVVGHAYGNGYSSGPNSNSKKQQQERQSADEENAARVDALLTELFPAQAAALFGDKHKKFKGNNDNGKKKTKSSSSSSAAAGKGSKAVKAMQQHQQHQQQRYEEEDDNDDGEEEEEEEDSAAVGASYSRGGTGGGVSSALGEVEKQMNILKKQLKQKDDKIMRLMEHSHQIAAVMDKQKGEVAYLSQKLKETELLLESKENRLAQANANKKKAVKKAVAAAFEDGIKAATAKFHLEGGGGGGGDGGSSSYRSPPRQQKQHHHASSNTVAELQQENDYLRGREQALMEAVEDLSSQNEDLIAKLRDSMQRELQESQRRAAMASSAAAATAGGSSSYLPSIHEGGGGGGGGGGYSPQEEKQFYRAQSEPKNVSAAAATDAGYPKKKTTTKKKKSAAAYY